MVLRVHGGEAQRASQGKGPEVGMANVREGGELDVPLDLSGRGARARLERARLDTVPVGARRARGAGADGEGAVEEHVREEDPAEERLLDRAEDPLHVRLTGELADEHLVGEDDVLRDLRGGPPAGA